MENSKAKSSLADIYPEWMLWRRDYTSVSSKTQKEDTFNWNKYLKDKKVATTPLIDLTPKDFVQEFRLWTKDRLMTRKQFNNSDEVFTIEEREILLKHLADNSDMYSLAIQLDFHMNDDLTFSSKEHINVDHIKGNTDQGFR